MEFRRATAPGKFGEKMVMRFLNSNSDMLASTLLFLIKQYAIISDQSSMKRMELSLFLDQLVQVNQQHWPPHYEKRH